MLYLSPLVKYENAYLRSYNFSYNFCKKFWPKNYHSKKVGKI